MRKPFAGETDSIRPPKDAVPRFGIFVSFARSAPKIIPVLVWVLWGGLPVRSWAEFTDETWGARPLALGGAYIGMAGDGYSPFINPAGIAFAERRETTFSFGKPRVRSGGKSRTQESFSFVDSSSGTSGNFGFWWLHSSTASVNRENTLAFSVARSIYQLPNGAETAWGASVKYLSNLALSGTRTDQSALSAEVGLMLDATDNLSLGLAVRDILRPHVGIRTRQKIPVKFGAGGALWLGEETLAALDIVKNQEDSDVDVRAGVEFWQLDPLAIRIGSNSDQMTYGLALMGGPWSGLQVGVEYTYVDPFRSDRDDSLHLASLRIRFGGGDRSTAAVGSKSEYVAKKQFRSEKEKETPAFIKSLTALEERDSLVFGPGDVLELHVQGHPELDISSVTVDSWGFIRLPYVGELEVQGYTREKIEASLTKIYSEYFKEPPKVDVIIRQYNSRVVYVLGQVQLPGRYVLERTLTLRDVIFQAGLPTERAANWRAFVVRQTEKGPVYIHINLHRVLYRANLENNIELQPGDVIYVPMGYLDSVFVFIGRVLSPIFGVSNSLVRPLVP
ncbi:MAG: polysaccharide export protein [Elusimicrobia bacterium]|nr:polysaccharide export protein [Elusimicrobiota bacterium]